MTELYNLHKKNDLFFCTEAGADRKGGAPPKKKQTTKKNHN